MDRQQTDLNPIANIYDAIEGLISGMIVKMGSQMDASEGLETRKYVDAYIDALNGADNYTGYDFTVEEFLDAGVMSYAEIKYYQTHRMEVPSMYREILVKNKHAKIIEEYEDPNNYYRTLAGIPPLETVGGILVDDLLNSSFLVVEDNADPDDYYGQKIISRSSARSLMDTVLFNTGDYIAITDVIWEESPSSLIRSFLIVEDDTNVKDMHRFIFKKDAYAISDSVGIEKYKIYAGAYLYISKKHALATTTIVKTSFEVVRDDINNLDYDPNTMVKLSEARLNCKEAQIGNHLFLKDFIYPTLEYEETYGLSRKVPVHKIAKVYGKRFINILEALGYFKELRKTYVGSKYDYLDHLGTKEIDILTARRARAYDLLWLPDVGNDVIRQQFSISYRGARDYFMSTVYNYYFNGIYDYYENFIGMAICQMAIQQCLMRAEYTALNRDFYDTNMVKMLFDAYDVPFTTQISPSTQLRIAKNLNVLIQNKASNKVIYDIASLLGYHDVKVYKYYLMKERKIDEAGNLVYADTTKMDYVLDENGLMVPAEVVVNDVKHMYDLYFQRVELKEMDYQKAFQDTANRVSYNEITMPDPLWWDDQHTFDTIYGNPAKYTAEEEPEAYIKHINYVETKYLGLTISYRLSEVVFEDIILLRMILEKQSEIGDLVLTFPNITGTYEVNLFDTIVFLCAMMCKQSHLTGEILTKVSTILDVIGFMTEDADGYTPCDTLAFNFEMVQNAETFAEIMEAPLEWMSEAEKKKFDEYLSILTVTGDRKEKITAFNKLFTNIKSMGFFIQRKMSEAEDVLEYRAWRDLYHALFIQKEISEVFSLGETGEVAKTYLDYLRVMNPTLYNVVLDCEDYLLYTYIDHVIYRMTQIVNDLSVLQAMNDSNSALHDYLIRLIKFFKSYTTDLVSLDSQYIFDLKPDNLLKLTESYFLYQTDLHEDYLKLIYSDIIKTTLRAREAERLRLREDVEVFHSLELNENLPLNRVFKRDCKETRCPYFCKEDPKACTRDCKYLGYDTSDFRRSCKDYIAAIMSIEQRVGPGIAVLQKLQEAIRAHLIHVGRIYGLVDSYRFYASKEKSWTDKIPLLSLEYGYLTDTLVKLNNQMAEYGINMVINNVGVDAIIADAKELTSAEDTGWARICKNEDFPCLSETKCPGKKKEEERFYSIFTQTEKIFREEFLDWDVDWSMVEYLELLEKIDLNVVLTRLETTKMLSEETLRSEITDMYAEAMKLMDGMNHMDLTQTSKDKIGLREDIYTYFEDPA